MSLQEKRRQLANLYNELERETKEMKAGSMPAGKADEIERKAEEAEKLEKDVAALERADAALKRGRQAVDPILPSATDSAPRPRFDEGKSAGQSFTESKQYGEFVGGELPSRVSSRPFLVKSLESKAVPTIATGVLNPSRISDIVWTPAMDRLRLRDVLNVARTTEGNAIQYLTVTPGAIVAAPVAEQGLKPEASIGLGVAQAPVRTIAAWVPVTEQQLQDVGQVQNIIDSELSYQVQRVEESQVLWGDGTGENFQGLLTLAGVAAITRGTANLLDRIRAGITDIRSAGGDPNGVVMHPLDAETIATLKDVDGNYLHGLVLDPATGRMRVWGLPIVETLSAQVTGGTTRNILVGDFARGATLFDRQEMNISIGWINDQFIRNMRTVRAEERAAFAIKRPAYFRKFQTAI